MAKAKNNIAVNEAMAVFELLDWWQPQRLFEETSGIELDRIKYLIKLRKEFVSYATDSHAEINPRQLELLEHFPLKASEIDEFKKLLPSYLDGDKFDFIDLFAGIGGIRKPFSRIGGKCLLTCEWDEYAQRTYRANWKGCPEHKFLSNIKDVTQPSGLTGPELVSKIATAIPKHDVLLAGFPCQPFSIAGVSKKNSLNRAHGFECEDQGQLFFDICRILMVKQPPIAILENVKNLKSHNHGTTFKVITKTLTELPDHQDTLFGEVIFKNKQPYWIANLEDSSPDPKVVDAQNFVPQHRERIILICVRLDIAKKFGFIKDFSLTNIQYPKKRTTLTSVIDPHKNVDDKYTLSQNLWDYLQNYAKKHKAAGNGFGFGMVDRDSKGVARTLSARYYKDGSEILVNQDELGKRPRRLTPQECARLMGFTSKKEKFKIPVSDTRGYKQFGNSVVVPVFDAIADLVDPFIEKIKMNKKA